MGWLVGYGPAADASRHQVSSILPKNGIRDRRGHEEATNRARLRATRQTNVSGNEV